jgi:hypothetical protein
MKNLLFPLAFTFLAALVAGCHDDPVESPLPAKTTTLEVEVATCPPVQNATCNPVKGAIVALYESKIHFEEGESHLFFVETDAAGKAVITNIDRENFFYQALLPDGRDKKDIVKTPTAALVNYLFLHFEE